MTLPDSSGTSSQRAVDWAAVRRQFPALRSRAFLNTATYGQTAERTTRAVMEHFVRRDERACADFLDWFDEMDELRAELAAFIHCAPDDIGFVENASAALSLLLGGIEWQAGDRVLTLDLEFPNNLYAPPVLAERGVEFVVTPWEEFSRELERGARLVILSSVNYTTGFRAPLEQLASAVRAAGALLYVDGTQSLGALQFDVRVVQPSMFAVHGYKWLLSPNGAGFMYVAPEVREWLAPSVIGWRSHRNWRNVDELHHGVPELSTAAERYEGGMLIFPVLYGMRESVRMMQEIGPESIERRVLALSQRICATIENLGGEVVIPAEHRSPIIAARFDGQDAGNLSRSLAALGVLTAARKGNLRVSAHFYNDESDIDALGQGLRALLR